MSPMPSDNKWNALAVGLPLWFWWDHPDQVGTSVNQDDIQITMTAELTSVDFDFGDDQTRNCRTGSSRPAGYHPLVESSTCGHKYLKKGQYTITATGNWAVTWNALGHSGTIPLTSTATLDAPVSEFVAVVVG
ncbi:MAG: hypothetical protein ACOX61_00160 [Brooklawnia sp.]